MNAAASPAHGDYLIHLGMRGRPVKIQEPKQSGVTRRYVTVLVDPGELDCGQKPYPNSTWVGTIGLEAPHKVDQWTPVGYKPRGFKAAAVKLLAEVRQSIIDGTAIIVREQ